jgi:hypothetical protein
MEMTLGTPFVYIPKSRDSRDHFLLDLGKLSFASTYVAPKKENDNGFSRFDVSLSDLEFSGNRFTESGEKSASKFLQDVHVAVVTKVLAEGPASPTVPETEIGVKMTKDLVLNLAPQHLNFILSLGTECFSVAPPGTDGTYRKGG